MKKLFIFFGSMLLAMVLIGCSLSTVTTVTTLSTTETTSDTTTTTITTTNSSSETTTSTHPDNIVLDLYSMNDFHGGAYTSIETLSNIGGYLLNAKNNNPYSIFLSTGDIFQGTALSNYYHGRPIIDVFNEIGFSSFTLGNHEFDWGIEEVLNYSDGNQENGEAVFPILAANVVYIDTQEMLPNTQPYTVVEIEGLRVGIIGVIGEVINSISASRVQNIEFLDPVITVYNYAEVLRTQENCDIVIASIHGYEIDDDSAISGFTGDHYVDAVFNGHTHTSVARTLSRAGVAMPYAQASNSSSSVLTKITLTFNYPTRTVSSANAYVLSLSELGTQDSSIEQIITTYQEDTTYTTFVSEVLATSPSYISRYDMPSWGASVIRDYMGVDIGILNSGGFRVSMDAGDITMGKLVEVYPFDNYLKTVQLDGLTIYNLYYTDGDVVFDDGVTESGGNLYINGILLVNSQLYTVAAVDYVFDKDYYPFLSGENVTQTDTLMRDLLAQDLRNCSGNFSPFNGSNFPGILPTSYYGSQFYYDNLFQSIL